MLLRRLDWRKRRGEDHILAYDNALLRTDSEGVETMFADFEACLLYTSPSPRDS